MALVRGLQYVIVVGNGPEFVSKDLDRWTVENDVRLKFTAPGKPIQNAYIESFN